jgi:signal peptidase II
MMSERKDAAARFFCTAVVCLTIDLATKYGIWAWVGDPHAEIVVIPGWLNFIQRLNTGGIWSLFHNVDSANLWLACFSTIAIFAILWLAWSVLQSGQWFLPLLLGGILGGAVGNLYDRWLFGGVRDWIDCNLQFYRWPTFNLADSFLVCGAIGLFLHSLFIGDPTKAPAHPDASAPSSQNESESHAPLSAS